MTTQETASAQPAARLDDYRWLTSAAAAPWLARAADSQQSVVQLTAELRKHLSPGQAHLVLEQLELRRRGLAKFPAAASMFFTARGLEQATDAIVAAYKVVRFPPDVPVADLCCGIGGDLQALAARGPVVGVDRDPAMAVLAAANLHAVEDDVSLSPHPRLLSREGRGEKVRAAAISPLSPGGRGAGGEGASHTSSVVVADVANFDIGNFSAWHIDPDRRPQGRRTTRVELHDPGPETIDRLRLACAAGAVKLAPAATLPDAWTHEAELEWISRAGECRQLVCWFGSLAREPGQRRATIVQSLGSQPRSITGTAEEEPPATSPLGSFLFEPDAAVLAARLTGALAAEHQLTAITAGIAYLTGERAIDDPALACFAIREVLPFDLRKLRGALAARRIGRLEIKKRGVDCSPEKLRRELKLAGEMAATLILLPIAGRTMAVLADRCV